MRYHWVYRLVDPRYQLEDPRHIRYVGHTSKKLPDQLNQHLADWPGDGGPKREWLQDMLQARVEPKIVIIEKADSAREAKEKERHWALYYESQGYELINAQLDDRYRAWDRQRVKEDFHIEVMRLLLRQDSVYSTALKKLVEKGEEGSALYLYLQSAETPDLSIEEIPALFRERDERVRGLEYRVMRAINSGEIQGPIASALEEAIEEGEQSVIIEEESALDRYVAMVVASTSQARGEREGVKGTDG